MIRRAREHDLVAEERLERNAAMPPTGPDDAELELALGDAVDDGLRVGDGEPHAQLGVLHLELAEQEWDDRSRPGRSKRRARACR